MTGGGKISRGQSGLLAVFCLILFGFAGISGRPLTMHEARLPQTSREMLHNGEWLLPTSGGRPWLERPPLPHWLVISAMKIVGHDDRVWIVRLPSALMGTLTVLMTVLIASRCFGLKVGLVSGYVLATSLKFYQYSSLAEDDIFLAALVSIAAALFTFSEMSAHRRVPWYGSIGGRSWLIWGFFAMLGLSNLTKGPLLGILILGSAVGMFLLLRSVFERSLQPILRYLWLWGLLLLLELTVAWPLWAAYKVPDVVGNWKYDYLGRVSGVYTAINEPWYYYPPKLALGLLPWTPVCLIGFVLALRGVFPLAATPASPLMHEDSRVDAGIAATGWLPNLWILCWAMVPLVVLSIPKGKHDHYLVPFLAPWAMLSAIGLVQVGGWIHAGRRTMCVAMPLLLAGFCFGEKFIAPGTDHTLDDTAFLLRCRNEVPNDVPLYIDGKLGPPGNLDFFRIQFYSRPDAKLLHNLTFLRDEKITAPLVYVICRQKDQPLLQQLGTVEQVDQSPKSHEIDTPAGRFTLYRLTFKPGLKRYPLPNQITSLQAMERSPGPWCGPEPE